MTNEARNPSDEARDLSAGENAFRHSNCDPAGAGSFCHSSFILFPLAAFALAACRTMPEVPITTPKPLEVNLNMRLDVYQYRGDEPADKEASKAMDEANTRMRNRMAEIFSFKANELVGENHRGLLEIRQVPAGKWGVDMKKQVSAENEDRMLVMRRKAADTNRTLQEVQDEQWKLQVRQANAKDWIEVAGKSPGTFQWARAGETGATEPASKPAEPPATPPDSVPKPGEAKVVP